MQLARGRRRPIQQSFRPEGRHAPRVEKLAGHVLHDPEGARDASQEALAKLCIRIKQFRGESQFSTGLHRLTVNACRDVANRRRAHRGRNRLRNKLSDVA